MDERQAALAEFGIIEANLLGAGGESWVYALDDERVLRLYKGDQRRVWYVEALQSFYARLPTFSFACPIILVVGRVGNWLYSIEQRIPGQDMGTALPGLAPEQRQQAFANYLHAVAELQTVTFPDHAYGELLTQHPRRAATWRAFLDATIHAAIEANRAQLIRDITDLDGVVAATRQALDAIPEPPKALVHGDYFPKNVMLDDLRVSGIIDFSPLTVVGDPFMDVAGGLLFLEVLENYQPTDSDILGALIREEYGADIMDVVEAYRLYYSFYFAGTWRDHPRLYAWCVNNLNRTATEAAR